MTSSTQPSDLRTQEATLIKPQVLCLAVVPKAGLAKSTYPAQFPLYWAKLSLAPCNSLAEYIAESELGAVLKDVLVNSLLEELWCTYAAERAAWMSTWYDEGFLWFAERQFLPGVTDSLAHTVEEALKLKGLPETIQIASGSGYLFTKEALSFGCNDSEEIRRHSKYMLYHPLTDKFVVHNLASPEESDSYLSFPTINLPPPEPPQVIPLNISDSGLLALSQERLLALTVSEMQAIAQYYTSEAVLQARRSKQLPSWPTDVEIEIIAQTWSEHCKHKIFNATIEHTDFTCLGAPEKLAINSLYKTYIQNPTFELMPLRSELLSVFEDNSGVVRWNNEWAVCFKVETHNSPSALEPYGGALTGILGVNRDVLGTGLGAKPLFNTDVFCFAYPSADLVERPKLLPAKTILNGVRKGVQDGGNKSGIPVVNGAIYFHPGYRAKPLVFCGTGGLLPITVHRKSGFKKHTQAGDTIVMVGGRVGKDGIHGATFSSEPLHKDSPVSAVQIGDPFTQKLVIDFIIEARDRGLITGITDNGAGGLSSSVGEMAQLTNGASLELDNIPLKYPGLADYEIVISESQERMTVSTRNFAELKRLAERYNVEATAIGTFHAKGYFEITRKGKTVALIDLEFLHTGVPKLSLQSEWVLPKFKESVGSQPRDLKKVLLKLLAHPNICSREVVIRQYDHEVQGLSVVKPLMGPLQQAPCDAAVLVPLYEENVGLVVANGLCPQLSQYDTHLMARCAVDEAVRNAVCVGADPATIVLLDNFCWPDPIANSRNKDGKLKLAQLVRACQGLKEAVLTFGTPLISGKDSMKNDFDDGTVRLSIPPTLLVSALGRIAQADQAVSMDFKSPYDLIYILSAGSLGLAGSQYAQMQGWSTSALPAADLKQASQMYSKLHMAITKSWVKSCHDVSEGGLAVALAECCLGSGLGANVSLAPVMLAAAYNASSLQPSLLQRIDFALFGEGPSRFIVTIQPELKEEWESLWADSFCVPVGIVTQTPSLLLMDADKTVFSLPVEELITAWNTPLPFD